MTTTTQTSNDTLSIKEAKHEFTAITQTEATKNNAIAVFEQLLEQTNDASLSVIIDSLRSANFSKTQTWIEINLAISNKLEDLENTTDTAIDNEDLDLDELEVKQAENNTAKLADSDPQKLSAWIEKLPLVKWDEFNSQCNLKLDKDTHLSLDGIYKANARIEFSYMNNKYIAKFNYGTGKVLLSSDYENYRLLGSIDKKQFTPQLDSFTHRLLITHASPTQSILDYRKAIATIESKLVRENTKNISKKKIENKELIKRRRSMFAKAIDRANKQA